MARAKMYENLVKHTITKNLSLPLSDSTEENWQEAFDAMEVLNFATPFTKSKLYKAFDSIEVRSTFFQRSLLEVIYANQSGEFFSQVQSLLDKTNDPKIFALCAEYLKQTDSVSPNLISKKLVEKFGSNISADPILQILQDRLNSSAENNYGKKILKEILNKNFLPGQIVMYSFQRKNRDYPGMVIVRNPYGTYIRDSIGNIFTVPQLARSISNLPWYLRNGNTPQGIYRMYGFGVSMSNFIGPTANIQMGMPVEIGVKKFFNNDSILDSTWSLAWYQKLIPQQLKNYQALYQSYYAGLIGRSEIISHGTTIDPNFYSGTPYYPLTPTQGCLCTREIWNGKRLESDQQKLVNGLLKAGGANGYCVVIEIDDKQAPVTLHDIISYLPKE